MENHVLKRDGDGDLEFEGELIAFATSDNGKPRWSELSIYETKGGNIVTQSVGKSVEDGEFDRSHSSVYPTIDDARTFFKFNDDSGYSWLALKLFEDLADTKPEHKFEMKPERIA